MGGHKDAHNHHHGQNPGQPNVSTPGQPSNQPTTAAPPSQPSGQPTTAAPPANQGRHTFHIIELKLTADKNDNYRLEASERGIPGFPHNAAALPGFTICLGLTSEGQSAILYALGKGEKVDPKMIYVNVFISEKGDIKDEKGNVGYKAGLIISAGNGVVQLGPIYSILSLERDGKSSLYIQVKSLVLNGQATIYLREPGKNTISLDATFTGGNGLWSGTVSKQQKLN